MLPNPPPALSAAIGRTVREHWRWFMAEGGLLVLLGVAAVLVPFVAGVVATVFLGWLLLVAGAVGLIASLRTRAAPGFGWSVLSGAAALVAGAVLCFSPLRGLVTVTLVLVAYFVADGLFMIVLGLSHRRELSGRWEMLLVNGVIDLILAAVIISGLPGTLAWALGLLVGIDLIFGGMALVSMALHARKIEEPIWK